MKLVKLPVFRVFFFIIRKINNVSLTLTKIPKTVNKWASQAWYHHFKKSSSLFCIYICILHI